MNICFLNYLSRSGSTLLSSYLNANPEVLVTIEADFPKELFHGKTNTYQEFSRLFKLIERDYKFKEWKITEEEVENKISFPVYNLNILKKILLIYSEKKNTNKNKLNTIVFKGSRPSIFDFRILSSSGIEFKMLYIFRDPRAVFNSQSKSLDSLYNLPFTLSPYEFALKWKNNISMMKRLTNHEKFMSIKYEDFVRNPKKEINNIFNFLEVEKNQKLNEHLKNYKEKIPLAQSGLHNLVGSEAKKNRIYAWKKEANENSIKILERLLEGELISCGYSLYSENFQVPIFYKLKIKIKQFFLKALYRTKKYFFVLLKKTRV